MEIESNHTGTSPDDTKGYTAESANTSDSEVQMNFHEECDSPSSSCVAVEDVYNVSKVDQNFQTQEEHSQSDLDQNTEVLQPHDPDPLPPFETPLDETPEVQDR